MSPSDHRLWAAFDPGLTTGLAVATSDFGEQAKLAGYVTIRFKEMEDSLLNWVKYWEYLPEVVIVEDYRKNPYYYEKQEKTQSKIETVQVIGMLKMWCRTNGIKCVEQPRDRKRIGYDNWGKAPLPKSNPMNHAYDAAAHLVYWLVQHKLMRIKV